MMRAQIFLASLGKAFDGWEVAVASMHVGELADFFVRSDYGYSEIGSPPFIPPNADLVVEMELLSCKGEFR